MINTRWHFNRRGQYTGQSISPGPFGYLVFLPILIGIFAAAFAGPIIGWFLTRESGIKQEFLFIGILGLYILMIQFIMNGS